MSIRIRIAMISLMTITLGCGGSMPEGIGVHQAALAPCPDKPNCVSSFATDERHQIAALAISGSSADAWQGLQSVLENDSSAEIERSEAGYLYAIYTSSLMRYRDDVEFMLRDAENEIAVRSASRVGHGDMGVNRSRIEAIRTTLSARGLVQAAPSE